MTAHTALSAVLALLVALAGIGLWSPSAHAVEIVIKGQEKVQEESTEPNEATPEPADDATSSEDTGDQAEPAGVSASEEPGTYVPLALRVPAEAVLGSAFGATALFGGAGAGYLLGDRGGTGAVMLGFLASWAVTPIGVWAAGEWLSGDGSLAWTYAGMVAGSLAAGTLGNEIYANVDKALGITAYVLILISGPVVAYEWSNKNFDGPSSVAVVPTFAVGPEGGRAGFAVVF